MPRRPARSRTPRNDGEMDSRFRGPFVSAQGDEPRGGSDKEKTYSKLWGTDAALVPKWVRSRQCLDWFASHIHDEIVDVVHSLASKSQSRTYSLQMGSFKIFHIRH